MDFLKNWEPKKERSKTKGPLKPQLDDAVKIALSSMLSTARANLSVGPPYDLGLYRNGSLRLIDHRIDEHSEALAVLHETGLRLLTEAIDQLPPIRVTD